MADGWAWNGSEDDGRTPGSGKYGAEEILATTLFNIYRSIGGDHPNLAARPREKTAWGGPMSDEDRFQPVPNMKVVRATGIFRGVRKASVARRTRGDADVKTGGGLLRLSLDSWEAPIDFEVTAVERGAEGSTVCRGTAPRAAGSQEVIAILVEENTPTTGDAVGTSWRTEVTRSTEGSPPDSVLELRRDAD